jgi:hypothetical protein
VSKQEERMAERCPAESIADDAALTRVRCTRVDGHLGRKHTAIVQTGPKPHQWRWFTWE